MNFRLITASAVVLLFSGYSAQAAIYISGHADIGVGYEGVGNELDLHLHADTVLNLHGGGTLLPGEYEADAVMIGVPDPSVSRPAGSQWDFLALNAGDSIWVLPQSENASKPFLGLATEELMVADGWSTVAWSFDSITTVSGANSEFSMWRESLGTIDILASTLDPGSDSWGQGAGSHDHQNFAFTGEGIYDVVFSAEATNSGAGSIAAGDYSGTATYRFVTGAAVPEPGSLLVLGAAVGLGAGYRRRRA